MWLRTNMICLLLLLLLYLSQGPCHCEIFFLRSHNYICNAALYLQFIRIIILHIIQINWSHFPCDYQPPVLAPLPLEDVWVMSWWSLGGESKQSGGLGILLELSWEGGPMMYLSALALHSDAKMVYTLLLDCRL